MLLGIIFPMDDLTTLPCYPIIKNINVLAFSHLFPKQYIAGIFFK